MTGDEINFIPTYERERLGQTIKNFYGTLPLSVDRPAVVAEQSGDFWADARRIGNALDNPEMLSEVLTSMREVVANTPSDHFRYEGYVANLEMIEEFENGTFTLFPNLDMMLANAPIITGQNEEPPPYQQTEQLNLFDLPSEQEQIEIIQGVRKPEQAATLPPAETPKETIIINQDDIDNALIAWNGDTDSKIRVFEYMHENARARETANYLKNEYGGDMGAFIITKDGAEPVELPWSKVQRRIAQLIGEDKFLSGDERAAADNDLEAEQDRLVDENQASAQEAEQQAEPQPQAEPEPISVKGSPPPVFVVKWDAAQRDFDLSLYKDRDVIAYDLNGVEHRLGRSGNITYVSSTGALWGSNSVPGNIYEQIEAYKNGELTDEDVRNNYLSILETHKTPDIQPEPQGSPMWQDYQAIAAEHRDKILFYRLGDYYEALGSDANAVAKFLNLTITGRDVGLAERVPMVGVPGHSLDGYVERLASEGFGVVARHGADEITIHEGQPQITVLSDEIPEQDFTTGYVLSYRYLPDPDRLIVFNDENYDPDVVSPIVARFYADGSMAIVDDTAPQSVIDELTEYATTNFEWLKEASEARLGQMLDAALEQAQTFDSHNQESEAVETLQSTDETTDIIEPTETTAPTATSPHLTPTQ